MWLGRSANEAPVKRLVASPVRVTDPPLAVIHTLWTVLWIVVGNEKGGHVASAKELWTEVAPVLRAQVSDAVWFSTFQDVIPTQLDGDVLGLTVPNAHVRERIHTRYLPLVLDALAEVGVVQTELPLDIAVSEPEPIDDNPTPSLFAGPSSLDLNPRALAPHERTRKEAGLNPRYTFETFVKGASNQFALAASLRVAETPARSYNPLFIYGSAGLGKTHLLHAIGHYVQQNYAHDVVRYVSTETFLNEYVDAIRSNATASFKRRYREIDVLLIDDIQFMEGKEGLQEEFFHTFNSLHGANKQVVISSDRMPDAIPTLEERLRGRFKWGLITDIQPPDLETRLAILRNKSERDGSNVPSEVLELIATHLTSNIRELEGALIRVTAYASLNHIPLTIPLAERLLSDLLSDTVPKQRTDDELLAEIANILGFTVESLCGKSRQRPLVTARQIAMYVFRDLTDLSYPAIARLFGGRDHTTVIHAVEKIQRLMSERKQIFDQVTDVVQRLNAA
jgi:chromosomal replication initiator protein